VRIVLLSDTHERHRELEVPPGDLLVHAGDITFNGSFEALADFDDWLGSLPHRHKVLIAGNHDRTHETRPAEARARITRATYLEDSGVTVAGLRIWGSPWQPEFMNWAFNLERGAPLRAKWDLIPADTDLLVTHGPPFGQGDECFDGRRVGCEELAARVAALGVPLHVFGHIHEGYGVTHEGHTTFVNASSCDLGYEPIQAPVVVEWTGRGTRPVVLSVSG
jgi:predicted phosphodiesterase